MLHTNMHHMRYIICVLNMVFIGDQHVVLLELFNVIRSLLLLDTCDTYIWLMIWDRDGKRSENCWINRKSWFQMEINDFMSALSLHFHTSVAVAMALAASAATAAAHTFRTQFRARFPIYLKFNWKRHTKAASAALETAPNKYKHSTVLENHKLIGEIHNPTKLMMPKINQ